MQSTPSTPAFEADYRPIIIAALGAGAMTIGVLSFVGAIWGYVPPRSQELVAVAARTSLIVFAMIVLVLVLAFLASRAAGPSVRLLTNLYGALTFIGGAVTCGSVISEALFIVRPETIDVPEPIQVFFALGALGLFGLCAIWAGAILWRAAEAVAPVLSRKGPK